MIQIHRRTGPEETGGNGVFPRPGACDGDEET